MGKFDVTAAAGTAAEEKKPAEAATAPAPTKPAEKMAAPKKPAAKPASKAAPKQTARKPAPKKATTTKTTTMKAPTSVLADLLDEADAQAEGTTQIAVRVPPSLKARLKTTMSRAGMTQEKFLSALIVNGLDELEALLDERESA